MTAATRVGPSGPEKGRWAWPPQHMRVGADSREKSHLGDPLWFPGPPVGAAQSVPVIALRELLKRSQGETGRQPSRLLHFSQNRLLLKGYEVLSRWVFWDFFPAWPGNST